MKHSIAIKFVAITLTALAFVIAAFGGAGILLLETNGLYNDSLESQRKEWYDKAGQYVAWEYASRYAAKHLGACSETLVDWLYDETYYGMESDRWQVVLYQDGRRISQTYQPVTNAISREYTFSVEYPVASKKSPFQQTEPTEPSEPTEPIEPTEPMETETPPLYTSRFTIWENGEMVDYYLSYYESPVYTIEVEMDPMIIDGTPSASLVNLYPHRYTFIGILISGLVLFAGGMVFLFWCAGVTQDGSVRPGGLNRVPLDLYVAVLCGGLYLLYGMLMDLVNWSDRDGFTPAILTLLGLGGLVGALMLIGFLFALAAQVKAKHHFWWRRSILGFCLRYLWIGLRFCSRGVSSFFKLLPVIWQWLLSAAFLGTAAMVFLSLSIKIPQPIFIILLILSLLGCAALICYSGYAIGKLLLGTRKMIEGNFQHKISTRYLLGSFRDFANGLNSLSNTALQAAKQQLKSERMKTELITNVSHDIKTPLTSIINFVDLLQRPHSPQEQAQYLDILSRQSSRMKKLIEDLMELSKASTGNLPVNIACLDAAETVNQALGEFSDKLDTVPLEPVFRQPAEPVALYADGKLTWRVLSNLLSNAVKYAMPGTRLYIDLIKEEGLVILSLKNVSRAPLHTNPEELMERFVQGDPSRSTEGSGLGLNIAHSLMEVQHGHLHLTVDGDIFKVTLTFPGA